MAQPSMQACNDTDPLSLEAIDDLQRQGRALFLHRSKQASGASVVHAYDAQLLFNMLEATPHATSPLTRQPFTKDDLHRLAEMHGRHGKYLVALRKFARWRAFMPTAMQAESDIDCLWSYMELLVSIGAQAKAAKYLELCVLLIFPWIFKCAAAIRDASLHGGPRLSGMLPLFEHRLRAVPPGAYRSGCEAFLARLAAALPDA
nr:hypothetical protein WG33_0060 [uncultured bacterium]